MHESLIKPQTYNLPTQEELWQKIQQIAQARYQHTVDQRIAGFHKLSCLRELCQSVGLKLIAKDRSEFTAQDIGGIEPILKCIEQSSDDAKANIDIGQKYMNEGNPQALDSFLMATQIIMNLFGSMHRDLGSCLSKISNVYFRRQEHEQAIQFQKQALQIYVNIYGLDHPITISALNGLSLYYFSWKKYKEAFNYMIHALYLTQVVGGEGQVVYNQFTNLSYLYSESGQHQGALNCQFEALERCETLYKTYGGDSPQFRLKLCNYYTAIAMEHGEIGDQQKAVDFYAQ
ncbi:hypothetical protein pb186bvf_017470 [Paramecium bursaria]